MIFIENKACALFFWGQSEKLYGVKELTSATLVAESGLVGALCQLMLGLLLFPIRGETHKESCLHIILLHTCLNLLVLWTGIRKGSFRENERNLNGYC